MINLFKFFAINNQNLKGLTSHYSKNAYILRRSITLRFIPSNNLFCLNLRAETP